jgi:DNA helicase-2/ATP-dependent DNA helicase PcrA
MEVDVVVRKAGRVVTSIRRPLREIAGRDAVTYRGRLWPVHDGAIEIQPAAQPVTVAAGGRADGAGRPKGFIADAAQSRIITAPATDRILVPAGPGSGKTEVLARRIAGLMGTGISPAGILVLSFSRSAVRTLTRRLGTIAGAEDGLERLRHVSIRTFDSWAFRLLRLSGRTPADLLSRSHDENIRALAKLLETPESCDIRDLVGERKHMFVDEFQDLTGARARLARDLLLMLAPPGVPGCGFTLLGDPAQAIYGFAGAGDDDASGMDIWEEIRERYGDGVRVAPLAVNHRSTDEIAGLSNSLRSILESGLTPGVKLQKVRKVIAGLPTPEGELGPGWAARPYATSAILARTNGDAIRVMQKLFGKGSGPAPARIILKAGNAAPATPPWVAALLSRYVGNSLPKSSFARIHEHVTKELAGSGANLGVPGLQPAWLRLLHASGGPDHSLSVDMDQLRARLGWPDSFPDDELVPENGLLVTTIHQSKGMEFDEVHLLEPRPDAKEADSPEEEASVGFVGVTRAGLRVGRIQSDELHCTLWRKNGADRHCSWNGGWVNLEMGIPGDVNAASFADDAVHGSAEAVSALQQMLIDRGEELVGHKVVLCRHMVEGKAFYDVHLQSSNDEDGQLLGRTTAQLTFALLGLLHRKGYALPSRIFNLRIGSLATMTCGDDGAAALPETWRASRLWLGCTLVGTGDFKAFRKKGGKQ